MRSSVSHTIQRPPFEALESGFPNSDSVGVSIWLNSDKMMNLLDLFMTLMYRNFTYETNRSCSRVDFILSHRISPLDSPF
ncbi:MAG: hypothetical protein A2157_02840 [Deltaproteobacteria bacterium RBG_16_47_11]|nr:MAG: hypothetical protein A2157_02840 [Deltaproteobacteria bacterium RBG_16_47_11]